MKDSVAVLTRISEILKILLQKAFLSKPKKWIEKWRRISKIVDQQSRSNRRRRCRRLYRSRHSVSWFDAQNLSWRKNHSTFFRSRVRNFRIFVAYKVISKTPIQPDRPQVRYQLVYVLKSVRASLFWGELRDFATNTISRLFRVIFDCNLGFQRCMRSLLSQFCAIWCSMRREVQQVSLTVHNASGDDRRWPAAYWTNKLLYNWRWHLILIQPFYQTFSSANGPRRKSHFAYRRKCKWSKCVFFCITGNSRQKF